MGSHLGRLVPQNNSSKYLVSVGTAIMVRSSSSAPSSTRRPGLPAWVYKLRRKIWEFLEDLFEEFGPWIKWLVFDAILALIVNLIANRFESARPLFELVGWL